jgi:hypothetical protein
MHSGRSEEENCWKARKESKIFSARYILTRKRSVENIACTFLYMINLECIALETKSIN